MNLKDEVQKDRILNQINQMLEQGRLAELYLTVTNMFERIYGPHSPQLRLVETLQKQVYDGQDSSDFAKTLEFSDHLRGCLRTLASEIREGLIVNIQSEARGEVLGGFLILARTALDEDRKDVAAVLACAALEDALKRCASEQGLDVQDQDMSTVVKALKSKSVIRGGQGEVLRGYVRIRNKAFHAQWEAIDVPSVNSIIAFTETFIVQQFSSPIDAANTLERSTET